MGAVDAGLRGGESAGVVLEGDSRMSSVMRPSLKEGADWFESPWLFLRGNWREERFVR